jgi:hypothetical protein
MAKFLSGRQSNFNIGIKSYTESKTVLQTIGKVGIGTTNAGNYSLYVVGDANITDNVTAQNYYGSGANLTGISTFANANITNGIFSNIYVSGISTLGITSATNLTAQQLNVSGIITASQFSTGVSGTGININTDTISGPATLTIDPAAVGDNTGAVRIKGDLYVDGTQFIVNSTTIELADFNVGIATTVGTNALLDGAGIGIGSIGIRKTIQWANSSSSLKSSENFNLNVGKTYKINGTDVLSNTTLGSGVTNSSLTSVGTLGQLNVSGISTLGTVTISSGIISATVGVVTYYGDGSNLQGVNAFNVINQDIISSPVFPTFASNTGVSSVGISTTKLVFVPVSGNLGLGTTNPTSKLHVVGDGLFTGNVTATSIVVSSGSTFTNGPILVGTGTSTGTASQRLQVTGGAYVSGSVGIGTTNPGEKLQVDGNIRLGVSTTSNYLAFYGTTGDSPGSYSHTYIGERVWSTGTERSELLLFKGNDAEVSNGWDRIRLAASQVRIDTYTTATGGNTFENIATSANLINRVVVHSTGEVGIGTDALTGTTSQTLQVTGGVYVSGNLGIGTTNPTSKLHVVGDGLFTGVVTATTFVGNIISGSTGTISIGNTTGISGQYLQSTGIGITWATFPTLRTTQTNTATAGQTSFGFSYNVNFLDVYVNGVKLTSSEYVASNGSSITLISPAFVNDIVEFISYNITSVGGGGGGGGASIIDDLSDVNLTLPPSAGENLTYDGYYWVNDYVVTATTTTTSQTTLHSLSSSSYRSVEYMIQATQGSNYHVTKILAIHDGTTTYPTEYGTLYTNGSLGTFDADISGGNIRLRVTPSSSSSTSYKIKFTAIKV